MPGALRLAHTTQPAAGKSSMLVFPAPWFHVKVSELVLFVSHFLFHYSGKRIAAISLHERGALCSLTTAVVPLNITLMHIMKAGKGD